MPISDSEFIKWQRWAGAQKNHILEINALKPDSTPVTLRVSSLPYRLAENDYRCRLEDLSCEYVMRLGDGGDSQIGASVAKILNPDGSLDEWITYVMGTAVAKVGDVTWPLEDYRETFSGDAYRANISYEYLELTLVSTKNRANEVVHQSDYGENDLVGHTPGTLIRNILTKNQLVKTSELDTDSFHDLDTAQPWPVSVEIENEDGENLYDLADRAGSSFLMDFTERRNGKLAAVVFDVPAESSEVPGFTPVKRPKMELLLPVGKVESSGYDHGDLEYKELNTIDLYPHSHRTVQIGVNVIDDGDREDCANAILDLYNSIWEYVEFETLRDLSNIELGHTVKVHFDRYGYNLGQYLAVTYMRDRIKGPNIIGAYRKQTPIGEVPPSSLVVNDYVQADAFWDIVVSGNYAYVLATNNGTDPETHKVYVYDIELTGSPITKVGETPANYKNLRRGIDVDASGDYVYITSTKDPLNIDGENELVVIDITTPSAPSEHATLPLSFSSITERDLVVDGDYLFYGPSNDSTLDSVSISNPAAPTIADQSGQVGPGMYEGNRIAIDDGVAVVVSPSFTQMAVFSVDDPGGDIGFYEWVNNAGFGGFTAVELIGDYAYITTIDPSALIVYDISTPSSPAHVKTVLVPELGYGTDITKSWTGGAPASDGHLFVSDSSGKVLTFSTDFVIAPTALILTDVLSSPYLTGARGIATRGSGSYVYVVSATGYLTELDFSGLPSA